MTNDRNLPEVCFARNWLLAHYDLDVLLRLGLPPNHSQRIAERDFSGYRLAGAHLPSVELCGFALLETHLPQANLREARLCCVDLSGADLAFALLRDADLRHADLRCTNLRAADFYGASLVGANLVASDLAHADLRSADIAWARLDQAGVTARQVRAARNWESATYGSSLLKELGLPESHNAVVGASGIQVRARTAEFRCGGA